MKKTTTLLLSIGLLLTAVPTIGANTVRVGDVQFSRVVEVSSQQLQLQGAGLLKVMVFVKAYAGAFYLPASAQADQALTPVAKRLVLEYYQPIKGVDFAKATRLKIADNVDTAEAERLAARIERLAAMYKDVQPGDRYALTYVPGTGTRLSLNDEHLGTIPGDDFARAVFAIWLGADPIDEKFRDRLLGVS